jgi:DNA-binding NarL/FixJ family response regulator
LSFSGFTFLEASNGEAALEILKQQQVDLVLLDVQMPIKNGVETFKELKSLNSNTKVIILTMFGEPSLMVYLLKLGVNGLLLKDIDLCDLERAINITLTEGAYFPDFVKAILDDHLLHPACSPNLDLTPREFQLLELIGAGMGNKEMADFLHLKIFTVESYRKVLMDKLKCRNTADLLSLAYKVGLHFPEYVPHRKH